MVVSDVSRELAFHMHTLLITVLGKNGLGRKENLQIQSLPLNRIKMKRSRKRHRIVVKNRRRRLMQTDMKNLVFRGLFLCLILAVFPRILRLR